MKKKLLDTKTRVPDSKGSRSRVSSSERIKRYGGLITLLTDFGLADYFVASVKGVILSINPDARIVDVTHNIPPQDVQEAAFTLFAAYKSFPEDTIHVAIVDPGVGSIRHPILIKAHGQFFVGPDNGIFSYVCEGTTPQIFRLTKPEYFRTEISSTFHGRDVFAPVAAALSNGGMAEEIGEETDDFVQLPRLRPPGCSNGRLEGRIIHIDRFGNCVTNISRDDLKTHEDVKLRINGKDIDSFRDFYAQESTSKKKYFAIWGSAGFLEISAQNGSAAYLLKAKRGDSVILKSGRTVGRQIQNRER